MIEQILGYIEKLKDEIKIVYLTNYDMNLAAKLVSGVDVWLNTPLPPQEASGTSGMKAAHNGVINFSVLDGWWIEGWIEGVTGWAIGPHPDERLTPEERHIRELDDFYNKLEYVIAPMFYQKREAWIRTMKNSIGKSPTTLTATGCCADMQQKPTLITSNLTRALDSQNIRNEET